MHWIREGGLFVIVCNLITVFKYMLLQFLPAAFANMPKVDFGWPGIEVTMLGVTFKWNILGYDAEHGGLPYFCAYMIAMILGEVINFPIQRNVVFRSKGNLTWQIVWFIPRRWSFSVCGEVATSNTGPSRMIYPVSALCRTYSATHNIPIGSLIIIEVELSAAWAMA